MRSDPFFLAALLLVLSSSAAAQSPSDTDSVRHPFLRLSAGYCFNSRAAESLNMELHQMDDVVFAGGRTASVDLFTDRASVTTPTSEVLLTMSFHPMLDNTAINMSVGRVWSGYRYTTMMPRMLADGTAGGTLTVESDEGYEITTFSIGSEFSPIDPLFRIHLDAIYALAALSEEQYITTPDAPSQRFASTEYHSSGFGFRAGAGINFPVSRSMAVILDGGYRGLRFYYFKANGSSSIGLDHSVSGMYGMIGMSYAW